MHNLLYLSYTIYYSPDFIWAWVSVYKYDRTHFLGRSEESEFVLTGNTFIPVLVFEKNLSMVMVLWWSKMFFFSLPLTKINLKSSADIWWQDWTFCWDMFFKFLAKYWLLLCSKCPHSLTARPFFMENANLSLSFFFFFDLLSICRSERTTNELVSIYNKPIINQL